MIAINHRSLALAAFLLLTTCGTFAQSKIHDNPKLAAIEVLKPEQYTTEANTYALPWEKIPNTNVLWQRRVWREIEVSTAGNAAFVTKEGANDNLAGTLLKGAFDGKIKAYSTAKENFSIELTRNELIEQLSPGKNILYNPANVTRYMLEEDWIFLKAENKLIVRILGIAPFGKVKIKDGMTLEEPLFWIYYPDAREYLAQQKTTTGTNWDRLFETRGFTSHTVRAGEPKYTAFVIEQWEKTRNSKKQ